MVAGDLNCAHRPIDIHEPKRNLKSAGFTPVRARAPTERSELEPRSCLNAARAGSHEPCPKAAPLFLFTHAPPTYHICIATQTQRGPPPSLNPMQEERESFENKLLAPSGPLVDTFRAQHPEIVRAGDDGADDA